MAGRRMECREPRAGHRIQSAYTDTRRAILRFCENDRWICRVAADGSLRPHITFDPFSRQWMYLLCEGAYGILRSPGWQGDQMVYAGRMTMIGVECDWRQNVDQD